MISVNYSNSIFRLDLAIYYNHLLYKIHLPLTHRLPTKIMGKAKKNPQPELEYKEEAQDDAVDLAAQLLEEMGISESTLAGQEIAKDVVKSELSPTVPGPQQPQPRRNRRKEKITARNKALSELVAEAEVEAGNMPNHRMRELEAMAAKIAGDGLEVFEIEADGHCLFASIADQLDQRMSLVVDVKTLRSKAAEHIRKHPKEFASFLLDEKTGELIDIDTYCDTLENTAMWGGEIEIQALSEVFSTPIKVYFASQPVMTVNEEAAGELLFLAYYTKIFGLGAHYNSLRDQSDLPEAFVDT